MCAQNLMVYKYHLYLSVYLLIRVGGWLGERQDQHYNPPFTDVETKIQKDHS